MELNKDASIWSNYEDDREGQRCMALTTSLTMRKAGNGLGVESLGMKRVV